MKMPYLLSDSLIIPLLALAFAGNAALSAAPPVSSSDSASSDIYAIGKALFNDATLSNPAGMSCASCHAESTGFTFPNSNVNLNLGPVPGIVPGRFGNRKPPTVSYAAYLPKGPPYFSPPVSAYVGGFFWDGRATDLTDQATFPFQNPNEMNNLVHNLGSPALVVEELEKGPNAALFKQYHGPDVFDMPVSEVFGLLTSDIATFETSNAVSPFSSKYDVWRAGKAQLSFHELNGLRLFSGSMTGRPGGPPHKFAQCALCHGIPSDPKDGPDIFTNSCYANIGVPRNPNNPFYTMTDAKSNPAGYNPAGAAYIDLGLGGSLYAKMGLSPGNMGKGSNGQGDYLAINGTFKAPTLRNVDKRPSPGFVKCYMHNGVFKSLYQVVHFYNTRNLTDTGDVIDYTTANPRQGLNGYPLWPAPEFPSPITLQNPSGGPASANAQVGNLQLTHEEENEIVLFLQTLSDGYYTP